MTEPTITIARTQAVTTLTLNRPAAMNSFTTGMHVELLAALNAAADDSSVRCVVITGAGRGFCAGQDLGDPAAAPGQDLGALITTFYRSLVLRLQSMPVPVMAAVNGVAAGAGANIALGCDIVVATRSAYSLRASVSRWGSERRAMSPKWAWEASFGASSSRNRSVTALSSCRRESDDISAGIRVKEMSII